MEKTERGYFETDPSIGTGRESYGNQFSMDPTLFTPSAFLNVNPNSNEDLNNILGGSNFLSEFEYGSGLDTGYNAWGTHNQGSNYSPYPNLAVDQQQYGAAFSSGGIVNSFEQSFRERNGAATQTVPYSDIQTSNRIFHREGMTPTAVSNRNNKPAKSATKKKSDTTAEAADGTPKVKKTRGRRKTKEKSKEEKRAKEERKLERNRMAASKCRQKKKMATEEMMENFNELERQNHFMKACLEEVKQDRNNVLALLLEHKGCAHQPIDKCLESQLERIAGEFEDTPRSDTAMLGIQSFGEHTDTDSKQFINSNPTSPSDTQSRRNSTSVDSIAVSRSGSTVSPHASPRISTNHSVQPQNSYAPQAWTQKFPSGYRSWQEQFSMPQEYQQRFLPDSKISHQHTANSASPSSPGESMSRQSSSSTSVCEENVGSGRNDSGVSNVDTPPEERKKNMLDSPDDEAISLVTQENAFQSRTPHMLRNQHLLGNPKIHSGMQPQATADPSDLKDLQHFSPA